MAILTSVWSVTDTSLHRIPQYGSATQIRDLSNNLDQLMSYSLGRVWKSHINPQLILQVMLHQVLMKIRKSHSGLNDRVSSLNVDLQDAANMFPQIHNNT